MGESMDTEIAELNRLYQVYCDAVARTPLHLPPEKRSACYINELTAYQRKWMQVGRIRFNLGTKTHYR